MISLNQKSYTFKDTTMPFSASWEIIIINNLNILMRRGNRLVATKKLETGDIEALEYPVIFEPSSLTLYSYKDVDCTRAIGNNKYTRRITKYLDIIKGSKSE